MAKRHPRLRAFVKLNARTGEVVPGSLVLRTRQPKSGLWYEISANTCCTTTTTTTEA
jgi:hypothetical protein